MNSETKERLIKAVGDLSEARSEVEHARNEYRYHAAEVSRLKKAVEVWESKIAEYDAEIERITGGES